MMRSLTKTAAASIAALLLADAALAQNPRPLEPGQSRNGRLTERSQRMTENDYYLDRYRVSGERGERIAITMRSEEFDSYIEVGRMIEDGFEVAAYDDDGAGELDARLVFTFPESGEYIVRARTLGPNATGTYQIAVEELPPPPPPPAPIAIRVGQTIQGSFTDDSPAYGTDDPMLGLGSAGRHYALYTLTGAAGQTVTIDLKSTEFDAYLEAGADSPLGFAVAVSNDDGPQVDYEAMSEEQAADYAGGLDARLTVTFEKPGPITIRATTLAAGTTGAYAISVE